MHRAVRVAVRPLARSPVTPNHLTTGRLLFGLAAALAWSRGWAVGGALIFIVSMLLDRADGELARLQNASTAFGHLYDIITDAVVNMAVLVGIGVGLAQGPLGDWALLAGGVAGIAVAYVLVLMVRLEGQRGSGAARFEARGGFDPDDAMLAVPLAMLAGWGEVIIVLAAIGAPTAALVITWHFRRRPGAG